jgi:hypothetical protein
VLFLLLQERFEQFLEEQELLAQEAEAQRVHAEYTAKIEFLENFVVKQLQSDGFNLHTLSLSRGHEILHKLVRLRVH